ncbi:glycosyl transferase [Bacteroidia bacterium]|nr:glycosyl transferase [Bacteroidia bacterium]
MKGILCITTYPPRECGIATFANDLIRTIQHKFGNSYSIKICALETPEEKHSYSPEVKYTLNTSDVSDYVRIANEVNNDTTISFVLIQHEFGFFAGQENVFLQLMETLTKPVIIVFHTVLSQPKEANKQYLKKIIAASAAIVVMTHTSAQILMDDYEVEQGKIHIIPHGTHLVAHLDKKKLKEKYKVTGRCVLTTFGLLSSGKSIETTLDALPTIIKENPTVLFLIIGKTHPSVQKIEGERYREMLKAKIEMLGITDYVRFVNLYLDLPVLLEYLQLTDIYLFTSSDPNQAVSGTFVYAMSCGCPIVATPIPHARELLKQDSGIIFDFKDSEQLSNSVNRLLGNEKLRSKMKISGLQKTASTAWGNAAIAYARLFNETTETTIQQPQEPLVYSLPQLNTTHIKRMSRGFAMIQFAKGNRPDIRTGYTLDDNARALMALCGVYMDLKDASYEDYIKKYMTFIRYCQQPDGSFLNYVDKDLQFTSQNYETGLEDSNGRVIMALGYFISLAGKFPDIWTSDAIEMFCQAITTIDRMYSPRSIAFTLKGMCDYYSAYPSQKITSQIYLLADKLVDFYKLNKANNWLWFENSLTYDNSILPESLLYASMAVKNAKYKAIAETSFDFLLEKTFTDDQIKVVSNQGWLQKEKIGHNFGEQPVDVAGTVIALNTFYKVFKNPNYLTKQHLAFSWFLGNNHLHQIIYNPVTGGCYDGLEENNINLNQGAESTVSYLMARLAMNDYPLDNEK